MKYFHKENRIISHLRELGRGMHFFSLFVDNMLLHYYHSPSKYILSIKMISRSLEAVCVYWCHDLICCFYKTFLSTPVGVNYVVIGFDMEVQPLVTTMQLDLYA